jgi:CheY-like chemotaxis protein
MPERTILLVEDNPDDVVLTMTALQENNILNKVAVAKDGVEALDYLFCEGEYATRARGNPQMVLLDLKLPKIDGLEVLRRIRDNEGTKRVPVVILTTSNEQHDMLRGYDLGANSFVRKPVDFADFLEAVKQLGLYWLVLNETPDL